MKYFIYKIAVLINYDNLVLLNFNEFLKIFSIIFQDLIIMKRCLCDIVIFPRKKIVRNKINNIFFYNLTAETS